MGVQDRHMTETSPPNDDTVIAYMEVTYLDGSVEIIPQTIGGKYRIDSGVLACASANERHLIQIPLTSIKRYEAKAVDDLEEIQAGYEAHEAEEQSKKDAERMARQYGRRR